MIFSVIGTGNMGQALVSGFLGNGILKPSEIRVCDRDKEKVSSFAQKTGCTPFTNAPEAVIGADYVLLSVKPQVIDRAVQDLVPSLSPDTVIISIAASVKISRLRSFLPENSPLVRVMYIQKHLHTRINLRPHIARPLISSVCMAAVSFFSYTILHYGLGFIMDGYALNAVCAVIAVALGVISYFYLILLCKGITEDEFAIIPNRIRRHLPAKLVSKYGK